MSDKLDSSKTQSKSSVSTIAARTQKRISSLLRKVRGPSLDSTIQRFTANPSIAYARNGRHLDPIRNFKVDTHVLITERTRPKWLNLCLRSCENEPTNIYIVDGDPKHVGKGRIKGYSLGEAPYVSFVDSDDIVVPGAFQACIDFLDKHPNYCGAYTDEELLTWKGRSPGAWKSQPWDPRYQLDTRYMHHLLVMRRKFVVQCMEEYGNWPAAGDFVFKAVMTQFGPWKHIDRVGYLWRTHFGGVHKRSRKELYIDARWKSIPYLMDAIGQYAQPQTDEYPRNSTK